MIHLEPGTATHSLELLQPGHRCAACFIAINSATWHSRSSPPTHAHTHTCELIPRMQPTCCPRKHPQLRNEHPEIFKKLSEGQVSAVLAAASSPVFVLTGGPGCGKTFTVRAVVDALLALGQSVALCAPTGECEWHAARSAWGKWVWRAGIGA